MVTSVGRSPVLYPCLPSVRSVIAALLLVFIVPRTVSAKHQIHKRFSKEVLQEVFHVENHKDVPEYELVHVRAVAKRDADGGEGKKSAHLKAFGKDYYLNLERNPHLVKNPKHLKVLAAKVKDGEVHLDEINNENKTVIDEIGEPYHDLVNEAAVTILHDPQGGLRMQGTIDKSLVIKPVPLVAKEEIQKIIATTADDEMFLDDEYPYKPSTSSKDVLNNSVTDSSHKETGGVHVVYRRKEAELEGGSDYLLMEPGLFPLPVRPKRSLIKRDAPETIWPEVLVIADFDTFNMHGANSVNIKRYFVSFWNGVDLRYKILLGPKVRISLAGIIISKGRDATPYLENNRVKGDAVDSAAALTDMGKYLFRERRLPTYDLAVVVTKLDLCRKQLQSSTCNTGTAGFAYVGGACVVNSRLEKVNSVAIVEDTGGFSGIIVAAHEVGHLLGAVHDGSPAPSYLGGPGAEHCRWEDGFIMSDLRHTERGFQWSSCSIDQFRHFLNSDTATCLHNVPHEDEELPRILPGKMLSLDAQCRKDRGTSACFKDDRVCAQLFCFDSKSGYCVSYRPAAEGSPCGDGQHCINGRCVTEHDNYIPDFTKITEVVVDKPETAATVIRPLVSKPDAKTTPDDNESEVTAETTASTPATSRRSKFRYNTVFRKATTTSATTVELPTSKDGDGIRHNNIRDSDAICDDVMETLAGGLTCKQFLRNYRPRYCSHPYIMTNCCASRKLMCDE